jgi:NAD(P)-dependent dehydrogenase (short-subunit alcohol dehydrogenase family)
MESIVGKTAVVTGGTRGIGRAIAERLLAEGARVAICARTRESVDTAVREMERTHPGCVAGEVADVSRPEEVARFFRTVDEKFGPLDILVNNAGTGLFKSVAELSVEEWQRTIALNLNGPFYSSREALARFRSRNGGFIINISSLAGRNAFAGGAAYNASKFGLNGFSEAMMLDHRYDNVRVSYIMPGSVATEFGGSGAAPWKIAPEDVAEVAAMLLHMPARTTVSRVEIRPSKPSK